MSLSPEEQFNEEWRSLFENAEDSPSEELWDSIVRRLDEEESEPIIPLWPRVRPWVYGVAAAFITLLIGWWALQSVDNAGINAPVATQTTTSGQPMKTDDQPAVRKTTGATEKTGTSGKLNGTAKSDQIAGLTAETTEKSGEIRADKRRVTPQNPIADAPVNPELERSETATTIDQLIKDRPVLAENRKTTATRRSRITKSTDRLAKLDRSAIQPDQSRGFRASSQPRQSIGTVPPVRTEPGTATERAELATRTVTPVTASDELVTAEARLDYEATYIKNRVSATRKPAPISRIVWYRAPETAIEPQEKGHSKKEYWAALTATPMSFNPMSSIHSNLNPAYLAYNAVQQASRQPATSLLQNQAQLSMAWQASSGVKFSKHWSVEAGIQYLNGRSQAQNNASVTNAFTNQTENLLVNAIRNSSPTVAQDALPSNAPSLLPSGLDKNNMTNSNYLNVIPSNQLVSNNFQYLQVPVQLGYHILPENKLSYSLLGGLMANVFLKNTVNGSLEVNASDQVYRPLAMAGTAGLRVNYHPTHHWSGSLTGAYQQSLQNGTQSNAQVQVRPQAIGVGFGLNYHF